MRKCKICKKYKSDDDFYPYTKQSSKRNTCKECERERSRLWRINNKNKFKKYCAEHYTKNKEQIKERHREYYKKNRKTILQNKKEYRKNNAEKCRTSVNRHYRNNKEVYLKKKAERERKLKWIKLMDIPFPKEIKIDWHHINNMIVVPLPRKIHKKTFGQKHIELANMELNRIFGIDFMKLLNPQF